MWYQITYVNNFVYIEEFPVAAIAVILIATIRPFILGIAIALVSVAAWLTIFSPRSPACIMAPSEQRPGTALTEDPACPSQ